MSSPGTSSFIGEFLISVEAFQRNSLVATLAALGMILGAAYSLWLYNRVVLLLVYFVTKKEGLMSPQTETKASVGFQAGVKEYKFTYYTPEYEVKDTDILVVFRVTPQPGVPPETKSWQRL
ncbi:hypothetical protein V6N11_058481 [Hibiscus sabdariffa]|uniref:Ribulose bisphosphate carboxylase large chain n=1 Tax=Hibiscus sabdariffa TaxID=183260 RepID=A0ABR2U4D4_9ROSI